MTFYVDVDHNVRAQPGSQEPYTAFDLELVESALISPSGDTTGATDRAAIQSLLNSSGMVTLEPNASYWLDAPLDLPTASRLIGDVNYPAHILRGSGFTAAGAGAADDPANCMLRAASTLASSDETTLSAAFRRARRSFSTTVALSSPIGKTYRLRSIGTASGGVGSLDTDIEISELVTVASGTNPYVIDKGAGAPHGAHVDASNTTQVREVTSLVRDIVVTGIKLHSSTTIGGAATQIACGIYVQHVINVHIDVEGYGFSRSAVEARFSRDCKIRGVDRGNCNGVVWERSCQESRISVTRPAGGNRFHANGIPRATLYVDYMSAGGVYEGDILGCVVGAEFVGYIDAQVPKLRVVDADTTERVSRDATRLPDLGGSQGVAGGLTIRAIQTGTTFDETPYGMVMGDVYLSQCGGPGSDGQQPSMLVVNTKGLLINCLVIENKGSDVTVTTPNRVGGAMFYDSYVATINMFETNGIEGALIIYGNFNAVHIGTWRYDPAHAFGSAQNAICWGMQGDGTIPPCAVNIGKMVCADTPTRLLVNQGGVTGIADTSRDSITIGELIIENVSAQGANYGRCRIHIAANGYTPATGELAEIIPPQVVTFANSTDVWSCVGHGLRNETPVYVRAQPNSAGVIPTGYSATTVYWIVNRADDTFQLSTTKGGAAFTGGSTDGTATIEITTAIPAIRTPTSGPASSYRHVVVVNGSGFGLGPSPTGYYFCSAGPMCMIRTDDVAHFGDLLEVFASTGLANNDLASSDPYAIVEGFKTSATAGVVQCRRV